MSKNHLKLSTMIGENFKIIFAQMSKNCPNLSTMAGEDINIYVT